MIIDSDDILTNIDELLSLPSQSWLLGAGSSFNSKIPLMGGLTERVRYLLVDHEHADLIKHLFDSLHDEANIENFLSHLIDYLALAERSKELKVIIGDKKVLAGDLAKIYLDVVSRISEVIRYGYVKKSEAVSEQVGTIQDPIVNINEQRIFIKALFGARQAGVHERRRPVNLFTLNYDTLLEDALALESIKFWDGFSGGAVAFRSYFYGEEVPIAACRANLIKLHGSIDWHVEDGGKVFRIRSSDLYPSKKMQVMIYPQSEKYVAAQRDPFSAQFDLLRRALRQDLDNLLGICGYSFGDTHVNQEIELGMSRADSRTTLIAFVSESRGLPQWLEGWRKQPWGERVYILTQKGVYVGAGERAFEAPPEAPHDWWTFAGVSKLLRDGVGGRA
jgi:hypothetical protein